ncbi:MAG: PadR family transcriptional regulator [Candidatus Dormibacteria bacterium]
MMSGFRFEQGPSDRGGAPNSGGGRRRWRFGPFVEGDIRHALRGGWNGRGRGFGGGRVPRGNVRAAILLLLSEQPRNGYQIMEEISQRSKGVWRPSPGSVYPALQLLEDEGLVRTEESDGQRLLTLTASGLAYTSEHREELGSPWDDVSSAVGDDVHELFDLMRQTAGALVQVVRAGNPAQMARATHLLRETKRGLYRILAEDEAADAENPGR